MYSLFLHGDMMPVKIVNSQLKGKVFIFFGGTMKLNIAYCRSLDGISAEVTHEGFFIFVLRRGQSIMNGNIKVILIVFKQHGCGIALGAHEHPKITFSVMQVSIQLKIEGSAHSIE